MRSDKDKKIADEFIELFEETFHKVEGNYLDRGTSLFESIDQLDHLQASEFVNGSKETIAGHIFHMIFYIIVLQEYITDERTGKTDWNESWVITEINKEEWMELKENLKKEFIKLKGFIHAVEDWGQGDFFIGVLSIFAHCAYHLGSVRQLLST